MKTTTPPAIEQAIGVVNKLTANERIALMKYISASLGGPRFFTADEVQTFITAAIQETMQRQALSIVVPGKVN